MKEAISSESAPNYYVNLAIALQSGSVAGVRPTGVAKRPLFVAARATTKTKTRAQAAVKVRLLTSRLRVGQVQAAWREQMMWDHLLFGAVHEVVMTKACMLRGFEWTK